jgi:hypothetical protein
MVLFHMTEFKQGPRGNFTHIFFDMQSRYAHLYNSIIFMVVGHVLRSRLEFLLSDWPALADARFRDVRPWRYLRRWSRLAGRRA